MNELQDLIDNNERWADAITKEDPDFFAKLARQQTPEYLWIGCSDARVPANEIVGMLPGDLFVHTVTWPTWCCTQTSTACR